MGRSILSMLVIMLVLAAGGTPVSGQARDSALVEALTHAIDRGHFLRISGTSSVEGRAIDIEGEIVRLVGSSVRLSDIRMIERREKKGGGAMTGAIIGTLIVGIPLGSLAAAFSPRTNAAEAFASGLAGGAMIGAPIGGLLGAVIRPAKVEWQPVFP